jgi:hypothetical protein
MEQDKHDLLEDSADIAATSELPAQLAGDESESE